MKKRIDFDEVEARLAGNPIKEEFDAWFEAARGDYPQATGTDEGRRLALEAFAQGGAVALARLVNKMHGDVKTH